MAADGTIRLRVETQADTASVDSLTQRMNKLRQIIASKFDTRGLQNTQRQVRGISDEIQRANRVAGQGSGGGGSDDSENGLLGKIQAKIGSMLKRVLIFSVLSKMFAGMKTYISNLISQDDQLSSSLESIKTNLASAFTPIWTACLPAIRTLLSWVNNLVAGIAQVVTSLLGLQRMVGASSSSTKKSASSAASSAKAAKKAQSLLGIDEINTINTDSSGGGGGGGGAAGDTADADAMTTVSEKWEKIAKIVLLIGATLGAMKLANVFGLIGSNVSKLQAFAGLAMTIAGIFEYIQGFLDAWQNGITKLNSNQMMGGTVLIVAGLWIVFGRVKAAIGGVIAGVGMVVVGIKDMLENGLTLDNVTTVIEGIGIAVGSVCLAVGNFPVAIAAAAVAAVAYVIQHWDEIKAILGKVAAWIDENVWQPILKFLQPVLDAIKVAWDDAVAFWSQVWTNLCTWISTVWTDFTTWLSTTIENIKGWFSGVWESAVTGVTTMVGTVTQWFATMWQTIQDNCPFAGFIETLFSGVVSVIKFYLDTVFGFFTNLWTGITTGDFSGMEEWANGVWNTFSAGAEALIGIISDTFSTIWSGITDVFTGAGEWFSTNVWTPITTVFDNVKSFFEGIAGDIWSGLTGGLTSGFETAKKAVVDTFSNIWGGVLDFFGIHSPSTLAAEDGGFLMDGFTDGVEGKETSVGDKLKGVFSGIWDVAKSAWEGVTGWLGDLFGWGSDDDAKASTAEDTATGKADEIAGAVGESFTGTSDAISNPVEEGSAAAVAALDSIATAATYDSTAIMNRMGLVGKGITALAEMITQSLGGAWDDMVDAVKDSYDQIRNVFSGMADWFQSIFSSAWAGIIKVFSASGSVFRGIQSGVARTFKVIVNSLIDGLNSVLNTSFSQINRALSTIRSYSVNGAKPFYGLTSVNAPKIPKLAQGAVIPANHEFLAVLGDQRNGTNIEAPLDTIVSAMQTALGGSFNMETLAAYIVSGIRQSGLGVVNIDGRTIVASINAESRRIGHSAIR